MTAGTVALIVKWNERSPEFLDALSDDLEISLFRDAYERGESPLEVVYENREIRCKEEDEFEDYVEKLLSQPFLRPEMQEHGVQWMESRRKIEGFKKQEAQATTVIASYAFQMFLEDTRRRDFILSGPVSKVKVKVYVLDAREEMDSKPSFVA